MMTKATAEYLIEQCANAADAAGKLATMFAQGVAVGCSTHLNTIENAMRRLNAALDREGG